MVPHLPAAAAGVVRAECPAAAVAAVLRSLRGLGERNHAPTDASGDGGRVLRPLPAGVSHDSCPRTGQGRGGPALVGRAGLLPPGAATPSGGRNHHGGARRPLSPRSAGRGPLAGHRPLHRRCHPLDRLRRPAAHPGGQHPAALEPAVGLRRRPAIGRRAAIALGDGRSGAAAARRRPAQSGAHGTGEPSLRVAGTALRGLSGRPRMPGEPGGTAGGNPLPQGEAADGSGPRSGRAGPPGRPRALGPLAGGWPLGRAVGLPPVRAPCRKPGGHPPRVGRERPCDDRRPDCPRRPR